MVYKSKYLIEGVREGDLDWLMTRRVWMRDAEHPPSVVPTDVGAIKICMDRDWGSKPGSAGVASASQANVDRRNRLAALALDTVDLNKVCS